MSVKEYYNKNIQNDTYDYKNARISTALAFLAFPYT